VLTVRAPMAAPTRLARRLLEWSLLAILVLFVVMVFLRQTFVVRGQAELAAVKTTVAALRTAMALHQLEMQVAGRKPVVATQQQNPFLLLQRKPLNYVGETDLTPVRDLPLGSWIFSPACRCVGYLPTDESWLSAPNGTGIIWYRVSAPAEPPQLVAVQSYRWQGQPLD